MRSIMRRVIEFLRQHLLIILGLLALLAITAVLWSFPAWPLAALGVLRRHPLLSGALGGSLALLVLLSSLPKLKAEHPGLTLQERFTLENESRTTLAQIVVRMGGIYALERVGRGSKNDHWPIMEVLMAYVRENVPWPPKKDAQPMKGGKSPQNESPSTPNQSPPQLAVDIQAVLTVLGSRNYTYGYGAKQPLKLEKTDLRGANLKGAQPQGANLWKAQLQGANLSEVPLQQANPGKSSCKGGASGVPSYKERTSGKRSCRGQTSGEFNCKGQQA
jgi:Pentapeptide repeats (8 copies)